jgi:hypothetical protein
MGEPTVFLYNRHELDNGFFIFLNFEQIQGYGHHLLAIVVNVAEGFEQESRQSSVNESIVKLLES